MTFFDNLYGNESLKTLFISDYNSDRVSHAYIIEGPDGSGKRTFSKDVAAMLDGGKNTDRIMREICPDISYISVAQGKREITVDSVRAIRDTVYLSPNDLDFKVYIIEDAEKMNTPAQNSLLKVLEEPPANVYFFLLCGGNGLLSTVRSRAVAVHTEIFDEQTLDRIISEMYPEYIALKENDPDRYRYALKMSMGSVGRALDLIKDDKGSKTVGLVNDTLEALRSNEAKVYFALDPKIPSERAEYAEYVKMLSYAMRDILAVKKMSSAKMMYFADTAEALDLASCLHEGRLINIIETCVKILEDSDFNANLKISKTILINNLRG